MTVSRSVFAAVLGCALTQPSAAGEAFAGRSLEQAIAVLEQQGLRVFYSSDLVRPWMSVEAEPQTAGSAADALAAILAPHGLTTRAGPQGSLLVVREAGGPPRGASAGAGDARGPSAPAASRPRTAVRRLEELVVAASRYELRRPVSASRMHFGSRDLEYLPDLGEDAVRAVARLPGTAQNGFSARLNIRGGAPDETLVRLDGLGLHDPFHLEDFQGVFSMIDPRIVRSMEIYTGGFPVGFGDRMSGVIDIESIVPSKALYHEIGFSFFNLSFLSSGRFASERGAWVVSLRRSNLDLLYAHFSEQPERPRYVDGFAKVSYEIGDTLTLTAHVLRAKDDIVLADDLDREEHAEAHHSDRYAWLRLEHAPSDAVSGATTLAHTNLDGYRVGTTAKEGISTGTLSDARAFTIEALATDWIWRLGDAWLLRAGGSLERARGRYRYSDEAQFDLLFDVAGAPDEASRVRTVDVAPSGRRSELYASVRRVLGERAVVELGLRRDEQTLAAGRRATLGPRLGVLYRLGEQLDLRATWTRVHQSQAIDELAVGDGETMFSPPQRADHIGFGFDRRFDAGLRLRVDFYQKDMSALRPRYESLLNTQILVPELKPDRIRISPDAARARGVELMLDSAPGPLQWWLGYSLSRVHDRFGDRRVPRSWDQTHALTAGVIWDTPKWNLSASGLYRSGWPTTHVTLDTGGPVPVATVPAGRNTERVGRHRTLDLRITRKIELARSSLALSFELANAFDHENPCCVEYELGVDEEEEEEERGMLVLDPLEYVPRIPSLNVLWKF